MNLTQRIEAARERLWRLPQWWRDRELGQGPINGFTHALNDLIKAEAYSKSPHMLDDCEASLESAVAYAERTEERIEDWATDPLP